MYLRTAVAQLIEITRAGLLDLSQEQITTFGLDETNDAVEHAAKHSGPFEQTVLTPQV